MKIKKISFHVVDVEEGQILFRCTKNLFECWAIADGCGDMIYQFGCPKRIDHPDYSADMTLDDFIELIIDNYESGNIIFNFEEYENNLYYARFLEGDGDKYDCD